jgi:outer membrane protein OmpA-like peptidoglycan-associated protein/opacity protein-like surface antigen
MSSFSRHDLGRILATLTAAGIVVCLLAAPATAQEQPVPKVELFGGWSYIYPNSTLNGLLPGAMLPVSSSLEGNPRGLGASLTYDFNRWFGLTLDASSHWGSGEKTLAEKIDDASFSNVSLGPKITFRSRRFSPFLEALVGNHRFAPEDFHRINKFGFMLGGGVDINLTRHIALRLFRADFVYSTYRFGPMPVPTTDLRGARLQSGLNFNFGGDAPIPPPNRSPVASCSIDKTIVYAGSGDIAVVRADASDPDNDPLTYSWTANGGAVDGSGPEVRWNSSGTNPRTYTISARVNDRRGGTASCSADIRVDLRPNRAPTMSCAADHNPVWSGKSVQITATASDPDGDPLTYTWSASRGRIRGAGATVDFDSSGLAPGQFGVTGHVDDGRGGAGECRVAIDVQDSPRISELEKRLDLHSIYFQTSRPYSTNPNGGLVSSQEQILVTLAQDFKEYLAFRPDAHLILGGHADHRGSEAYNKSLTERRVARTKSFLSENGVPADRINTQAFGEDDNLNADQVTEQINQNPDLTPDERQQMLSNMKVMVLANNRRVDISLSTTGQQSTHRYPFNAKDYLALISIQGGERKPATKQKP